MCAAYKKVPILAAPQAVIYMILTLQGVMRRPLNGKIT